MKTIQQQTDMIQMSLDFVMTNWRPGNNDWSWADVMANMREHGQLHATSEDLFRGGFMGDPILLGGDGRIWDGHKRIVAAYVKGNREIYCSFGFL